jgi:UDP-N-acetylglucosamine acyltransferase
MAISIDIPRLVRQLPTQYPFVLVDRVVDFDSKTGLTAVKNVSAAEEYFEGHFPGAPVMPGVLIMESLAQSAGIWLLQTAPDPSRVEVHVVGIDDAKFRRPVVPGDRLLLEVRLLHRRGTLVRVSGDVRVGEQRVAEARLLLQVHELEPAQIDPSARIAPGAWLGPGVRVGPYAVVGPHVRIGAGSVLESHTVVQGHTRIGERNHLFPFCSVGQVPQDLKYRGEVSTLEIGDRNVLREYVTVHVGTSGGGGVTRIGSDNLFMAHAHVAHDCHVGSHTIFANGATLAGHVEVADHATIGAFSGVHQFCRVGTHAFLGGYTVATKDVLPFSKTVGNRARIYGANSVGLARRGFSPDAIAAVRRAFRVLLVSRLNTQDALTRLEAEGPLTSEVQAMVEFIRTSQRGVILKRGTRASGDEA